MLQGPRRSPHHQRGLIWTSRPVSPPQTLSSKPTNVLVWRGWGRGEGCETLLSPEPKPWQRGQGQTRPGDRDWGLAAHMPLSGPAPPGKPLTPMGPECGARGGGSIEDMGQGQPLEPPPPPQGWAAPAAPLGSVSGVRALATGCTPVTLHSRGPSLRSRSNGTVPRAALPPLHKHLVCLRTYRPGSTFGF